MRLEWKDAGLRWPGAELYNDGQMDLGGAYEYDGLGVFGAKCFLTDRGANLSSMAEAKAFVESEVKRWAAEYLAAVACRPGSSDGSDKSDKSDGSDKAAEAKA